MLLALGGALAKKVTLGRNLKSLFKGENDEEPSRGIGLLVTPIGHYSIAAQKAEFPQQDIWQEVIERIKKRANPQVFFWFASLKPLSQTDELLTLKAKNNFARDWLYNHYLDLISKTIEELHGRKLDIKIVAASPTSIEEEIEEGEKSREINKEG